MKKVKQHSFKHFIILFAGLLFSASIMAQDRQERELPAFTMIEVSGALSITLGQSENQKVTVIGNSDIQESVITEVKDGVLKITQKKGTVKEAKIEVLVVELKQVKQTGATKVRGSGLIKSPELNIETSGASSIHLEIETDNLTTNITGAGEVMLSGKTTNHTGKISGAGSLKAAQLVAENTDLNISGAGDARVNTTNNLTAQVNGAGSIKYVDEPQTKSIEVRGAGSVGKAVVEIESDRSDTTKIRIGNSKVLVIPGDDKQKKDTLSRASGTKSYKRKNHWAGIDVGVAGYISPEPSFGMRFENRSFELDYSRSRLWNINFFEKNFWIAKNHVGLVTGMGFTFARYHFNDRQTALNSTQDTVFMSPMPIFSRKHFLSTSHLTVPLLLEFNTHKNPKKSFHLAAGVIGAYRIGSRNVQVTEQDGRKVRNVTRDGFNMDPFKLDATVRFGYGKLNLFATYGLTNLFQTNRGPELLPVSAGVTLVGWGS